MDLGTKDDMAILQKTIYTSVNSVIGQDSFTYHVASFIAKLSPVKEKLFNQTWNPLKIQLTNDVF